METNNFLRPLISHWGKIAALSFLGAAAFSAYSFTIPKTYRVAVVLESPYTGNSYMNAMVDIKAYMETDVYTKSIAETCGVNAKDLVFSVTQPRDSNIASISFDTTDIAKGKQVLSALTDNISSSFKDTINLLLIKSDQEINRIKTDIGTKNREITLRRAELSRLDMTEKNVNALLEETRNNSNRLIAERDSLLKAPAGNDRFSILMYSNTVQQSLSYLNEINKQLSSVQQQKESLRLGIANTESNILKLQAELSSAEVYRLNIKNINIVSAPAPLHDGPIAPRKRLYAIAGLFLGLLLGLVSAYAFDMLYKQDR